MNTLALVPLLPLAGFLVNGLAGARLPKTLVALIGCALPAASFALVVSLWLELVAGGAPTAVSLFTWAATGGLKIDAALYFDRVAAVMCLVITGIGTLIHVYSIGYMRDDRGFARYFAYLNLFLFFMLLLALGSNLVVLFIGWEGVGLASYLLIGFWFDDRAKTAAGLKAFVVNRVGDAGFLLATFLIFSHARSVDLQAINAYFAATPASPAVMTAIGLLLLLGACGKSAQIPLHVWLPDAMAGPTPVSALIHAATMVTAGVYLLARLNGVFLQSPDAMTVVAWLGAMTALAGASLGVIQFNLKKVLAYSTMSQLGLMVMACGLGAFSVGLFHLITHAFFKACLFLGAGAVLHALGGEEDMRRMGALARRLPFTFTVFLLATLALCGVPPFAGFFSKDEILWSAWSAPGGSTALWLVASAASLLTAYYMFRAIFLTFFGTDRVAPHAAHHLHEPPPSMSIVLALLAAGSVLAGLIGLPQFWRDLLGLPAPFYRFVEPVLGHAAVRADIGHSAEWVLMLVAVALAFGGIALAWWVHGRSGAVPAAAPATDAAETTEPRSGDPLNRIYAQWMVPLLDGLSAALRRGPERALRALSVDAPAAAAPRAAALLARLQSGDLQMYLLYALIGLAALLGWGVLGG
ncbi:MAG: NADH-quinone oxidoreductase subunit L [Betaproteobacteria bacterium]